MSADSPWLKRFFKLACRALYVESAIPAISPTEENVQGVVPVSVQPEYRRRSSALSCVELPGPGT